MIITKMYTLFTCFGSGHFVRDGTPLDSSVNQRHFDQIINNYLIYTTTSTLCRSMFNIRLSSTKRESYAGVLEISNAMCSVQVLSTI